MSDLVERLRSMARSEREFAAYSQFAVTYDEAADEIARLTERCDAYKGALESYASSLDDEAEAPFGNALAAAMKRIAKDLRALASPAGEQKDKTWLESALERAKAEFDKWPRWKQEAMRRAVGLASGAQEQKDKTP